MDIEDYPYHVREIHFFLFYTQWLIVSCVPLTNKTIYHSHVVLIGSQYSAVTVSRYYFRINRISDKIRYFNTGIDPNRPTIRLQRRIHTRILDYNCSILRVQCKFIRSIRTRSYQSNLHTMWQCLRNKQYCNS